MRTFHWIALLGTALFALAVLPFLKSGFAIPQANLLAQNNTYFQSKERGRLVKVQILVKDSPDLAGLQIVSVTFNGQNIPLKPRDIHGNRGSGSFQVEPGSYKLRWVMNRNDRIWPREVVHEDLIQVSPRDLWIQVSIIGEKSTIL